MHAGQIGTYNVFKTKAWLEQSLKYSYRNLCSWLHQHSNVLNHLETNGIVNLFLKHGLMRPSLVSPEKWSVPKQRLKWLASNLTRSGTPQHSFRVSDTHSSLENDI